MNRFLFDVQAREQWIQEIVSKIEATPFLSDPFPHISVQEFLPTDVYADLHRLFPEMELFHPFGYEKHHNETGESNRFRFQTNNRSLERLNGEAKTFWHTLRSVLGSDELKQAIFAKLSPGLKIRYGCPLHQAPSLAGFALPELFHETEGYSIKPHPDTRKKVVTMQIALPTDRSQKDLGTEFYRRAIRPSSWLREPRGFDIAKRMPFLPNAAFAFVVLNGIGLKSWHGRTMIEGQETGEGTARRSILNIWYDNVENACTDIADENAMMRTRPTLRLVA